ncbi:MAG TPA: glucoamylase family protein, partial [Candidatus Sumerlaeota bacterium]|nr:glucoamylase family protein [Candidatus Sumerlaeota bacterium]
MTTGTLITYFTQQNEAREAFKKLQQKGYPRTVWLSKDSAGGIQRVDPFPWRRVAGLIGSFILFGTLAAAFVLSLEGRGGISSEYPVVLIPILLAGMIGSLCGAGWIRRSRFGVELGLIENHARWLIPGETVLILQAPIEELQVPLSLLREIGESSPAIFVLHPGRVSPAGDAGVHETPLNPAQLEDYAQRLAAEHQVDSEPIRDTELLKRLERSRHWVHRVCVDLSEASRLQQSVPPTSEWLLDNEYLLESNARDVLLNLPWHYYRQLPVLSNESYRGMPRIYALAWELAAHTDLRVDQENILAFIESYQSAGTLSIGELWAVPQMLRMVLIEHIQQIAGQAQTELREREIANFWANRLITANRRDPNHLFSLMAELTETQSPPSSYFALQLFDFLYDEGAALAPVQIWLERTFQKSMTDLIMREKNRQTKEQISIGNAFTSLRHLALLDWKECFERLSRVEQILRQDPAGIYPQMDFVTRNQYRRAIEDLHRGSGLAEDQVAQRVLDLATQPEHDSGEEERPHHIGTYLIGEKRAELARLIGCRETLRFRALHWAYRHHSAVYFLGLSFLSAIFISTIFLFPLRGQAPGMQLLIGLLLLIPVSQISLEIMNYLVMLLFPPRSLPKMDFRVLGIPDACRTLVVVPMMLVDVETIKGEAEKLEIRYLANKEANLLFALYSDYLDAPQLHCEADSVLLQTAKECIEALNQRHGGERFFLLHRERKWCESEQKFIGWERKRGKLEELNDLIVGTRSREAECLVYVGDPEHLTPVRFIITLDSDTQLPHDTARRMIETLAHPLNQPRFDDAGRVVAGSYTLIQPRVSPSLPSASGSPFSRLFSDPVGIDPYTNAVSDAYQDLTGEGSYHGKGIYDVRAFSRVLSGRFPEARLLSHDLIEGAHVRVGLASDIELYDEFPQDYLSYIKRQHRWIRGDWQIADWILPHVPERGGGREPNPLSWFNRWKIFDNLRRSLLPATSLALLLICWLTSTRAGCIASVVVATQLFFHSLVQPFTWATTGQSLKGVSLTRIAHDLLRVLVEAALLPYQTWLALDAIARVLYRKHISHRGLLEWTSAQAMNGRAKAQVPRFLFSLGLASLFSVMVGWAVLLWRPENIWMASPWLTLWFLSLLIGWLLSRQPLVVQPQYLLPASDRLFLRNVARRTWRYFSDFVTEETSWLPPDNYQVSHQNRLALRTSPTNIGLYLVSVLSAHDFGYLTLDDVEEKLARTMGTIEKLERHEGHLLNWYDIQTLAPLNPRYVSTVDSGNLLGALWTLEQGLESLIQVPLLDARAFAGLCDTGQVLRQAAREEKNTRLNTPILEELLRAWESPPNSVLDALLLLRRTERNARELTGKTNGVALDQTGVVYWVKQIQSQLAAGLNLGDRYLAWIEILAEKTENEVAGLDSDTLLSAFHQALHVAPSLKDLADGNIACIASLQSIREHAPQEAGELLNWIDRVFEAFGRSKWFAGETLDKVKQISRACHELSESVNMRFLYNTDRRLFSIGFNVSEGRLDRAFYDLLASEARLGSFVAIARGDIPVEHWFVLSRPYGAIGRHRALLSWTGTMFEYLMPLLFQRSYGNSLLDKAAREAVAIQIAYGHKHRTPWGISECAFGDLDLNKTYQYSAFGVPELGLKRGFEEKIVVAPYATLLAVSVAPQEVVQNLKRLADLRLLSDYGYYESLDYSRQPNRVGESGVIVRAYMAHHQGMCFLALTNFLHDDCLLRHFHSDPRVRTFEPLLHERIPHLPPLHHVSTRERITSVAAIGEVAPSVSQSETPHTATPKTQLLCNGRYGLLLTGAGGGYSRWDDFEITRWRADTTRDSWGTFCYIHDTDLNRLWCNSYHPTGGKVEQYSVNFTLDRAKFRRVDHEIESETEVIVAPEDDVEIRRMTLINRSTRPRRLNLTSYLELTLAPHRTDLQHPAFNKLFIQTEALPEQRALLAWRRPRSDGETPVHVAHRFTLESATGESGDETLRFETDRLRFIGRGRTLANPMGALQEPGNNEGFVLDPILSLRQNLTLAPGQRVQVSLVLAAGSSREQVVDLMNKYGDPHAITRAMDFAWESAQLELRLLRIQPDDARHFQQLASHLLYPNPLMRCSAKRMAENRKGQAGLWAYAISGDWPLALVTISEVRDLGLIRQMLQAHTYWRMHGLMADLVILNEETSGYTQPLREELEHLIQAHSAHTGIDRPGGIYLRSAHLIAAEDLTLLRAVASVVLVATRGTLSQQLGTALEAPELPEPMVRKRDPRDLSAALPFMELNFFNSLGGFTPDGREYAIYLGPGMHTPAPWVNVMANPTFGTLISETGAGFTWQGNSQRNRLTQWSNDPVMDTAAEAIYIRDEETGIYWTPTASPIREETAYRARHGAGYTVFEHNSHGIDQELTVFVPVDDQGGEPIKLQRLILRNDSGRPRKLSLTYYVEWTLGEARESSQMQVVATWDDEVQAMIARNHYHPDYADRVAFAAVSQPTASYTADRTAFLGRNRSTGNPAAMDRIRLARRTGAGLDPCTALQVSLRLAPG